ncbi:MULTISPECIES: M23 family metallopeptidase [Oceanobacillus]|uniref:L-Ala--D-Glu endopeptidase n=1 Tax=Oceanobacillus kimchii TaxID=746691 RepID=A0ABQ5TQS8_9BACI|nr:MULTISPECIES: M23 family metallopeptidase [Oceanobacillus]MCT1579075.1 M23 family metallopeptidase [Oceanobacillus kimchii]MCT2137397.1 M23 family metallopeptidase [Oceanobacillus kimchii]GLO67032.1 L-Ala--D-Glu endopeptidase [Oceanobacillus kimchii]
MYPKQMLTLLGFILFITSLPLTVLAEENKENDIYEQRMALFKKTEAITQIPWYYFAAIDNYERNIINSDEPEKVISIDFTDEIWYGLGNAAKAPEMEIIQSFGGIGKDGNGDGKAQIDNEEDILYSMGMFIEEYGLNEDDIKIALWEYYKRDLTVQTIMNTSKVFKEFGHVHLTNRAFPVDTNYNYSFNNTWGDRRGFGGLRIHEGTDIFASYGVPVQSTTYGVVEMMGWNLYGGWRIGIRDIYNIYHYYAHMNGYSDDLKVGQVVQPGDVIGSVGSTGYGPPGTSGKFPPHLHYGMYKDNGYSEFSFDPYPYLKKWERMSK